MVLIKSVLNIFIVRCVLGKKCLLNDQFLKYNLQREVRLNILSLLSTS